MYIQCSSCRGARTIMGAGMMGKENCPHCNGAGRIEDHGIVAKEVISQIFTQEQVDVPVEVLNQPKKQRGRPKRA